jgi:hypothetical protein
MEFFDITKRTSADQLGSLKFGLCNDYLRNYLHLTPWIGANINLTNKINLFSRIAQAKYEPAILDWYDPIRGPLIQFKHYPENDESVSLKPESVINGEVGFGYLTRNFEYKINYYRTQFYDKIATVIDINDRRTTLNAGNAVYQGFENELYFRINNFELGCSITLAKNRWNKISVKELFDSKAEDVVGKVVPFSPERIVAMSLGYSLFPKSKNSFRIGFKLNYWDEYYGTYTNYYTRYNRVVMSDNLPYWIGTDFEAKLPHFLDISAQCSYTMRSSVLDVTFRIDSNNMLNRSDNFMRAQYSIDYTRNDDQAGKYNWYVLQAPLFNIFFTTEITIH